MKKMIILFNMLIAICSFFTFIIGNITIEFGNKFNSWLHILLGYIIIVVPIIATIIFNVIMALKKGRIVNNILVNFMFIVAINMMPYLVAYWICWGE